MFQEGLNDNPNIDRRVLKHTKWWSIFNAIKKYFIAKWRSADKVVSKYMTLLRIIRIIRIIHYSYVCTHLSWEVGLTIIVS